MTTNPPPPAAATPPPAAGAAPAVSAPPPATTTAPAAQAPLAVSPTQAAVLDQGTFQKVPEPRASGRLPLGDGTWHQLSRKYVAVRMISLGFVILIVAIAAYFLSLTDEPGVWIWIPAGVVLLPMVIAFLITPRQARSFGYQLRKDDLVFRRGILWQRIVAVPYGRMQLVDITHGPLDRAFGIAQLKLVTAATTGVTLPGLTQAGAEQLRDTLVDVAETRRTGL